MAADGPIADLALGVLGGMGPEATADFLSKLVAATPVDREEDHLRVFIDSNPKVPDRHRAIRGDGPSPGRVLAAMAAGLERSGADFIVMACNTAHAFEAEIRRAIAVPFVSMIDEAVSGCALAHPFVRRVGLLAAQGCLDARLYQDAFARDGREVLVPTASDQRDFMALLIRVKRGERSDAMRRDMREIAESLCADGAEVIVAGCTEVPLLLADGDLGGPLFDPTMHLARRCVRYARRMEALPEASPARR